MESPSAKQKETYEAERTKERGNFAHSDFRCDPPLGSVVWLEPLVVVYYPMEVG